MTVEQEDGPGVFKPLLVLALLLFGGGGLGMLLADALAPGSTFATAVGMFMLPLCLGAGLGAWYSVASTAVWSRLVKALFRVGGGQDLQSAMTESFADMQGKAMPGTWVFIPVSVAISAVAGLLIAIAATSGALTALAAVAGTGIVYGLLLRWLARNGHLPLPDEA